MFSIFSGQQFCQPINEKVVLKLTRRPIVLYRSLFALCAGHVFSHFNRFYLTLASFTHVQAQQTLTETTFFSYVWPYFDTTINIYDIILQFDPDLKIWNTGCCRRSSYRPRCLILVNQRCSTYVVVIALTIFLFFSQFIRRRLRV